MNCISGLSPLNSTSFQRKKNLTQHGRHVGTAAAEGIPKEIVRLLVRSGPLPLRAAARGRVIRRRITPRRICRRLQQRSSRVVLLVQRRTSRLLVVHLAALSGYSQQQVAHLSPYKTYVTLALLHVFLNSYVASPTKWIHEFMNTYAFIKQM